MPKGSGCESKECLRNERLRRFSGLLNSLIRSLEYQGNFPLDAEEILIGGRASTLEETGILAQDSEEILIERRELKSEETEILPQDSEVNLAEDQNFNTILSNICQLIKISLLIDREGNTTPQRIREIKLEINQISSQLELLERYFEQEETDIETTRQIENVIETQIGSLLKILLYLPEQP